MARTVEEVQADLDAISAARQKLLLGQTIKSLTVGSNDMQRRYSYQGVTVKALDLELQRLEGEMQDLTGYRACDEFRDSRYSSLRLRDV